ncbi:MAG: twin-arginine translocation pathway signal protein [Pseudomonadota bacterium]
MLTRRGILKIGAASVAVLGATGATWWNTRSPIAAYAPWDIAGKSFGDPRLDALAYAILVPNPHNRQPWKVALNNNLGLSLYCDLDRRLPETDPFDRQITIGLGCFLEALRMAAASKGYMLKIDTFPDGEPTPRLDQRPIAHIEFIHDKPHTDPLFEQMLLRHTHRYDFDTAREISPEVFNHLLTTADAKGSIDVELRNRLRERTWSAMKIELTTQRTVTESALLTRFGKQEIIANPDGLSMSGPAFELMNKVGFLTQESMMEPNSSAMQSGFTSIQARMSTAMGYVWLDSDDNERKTQLNMGKQWLRLHLKATELGLAMQPLSQALQEFPEMQDEYQQVHNLLNIGAPARLQMLGRIGYAKFEGPSPRWPLETIFIRA